MTYLRVKRGNPYLIITFNEKRGRISKKNLMGQLIDIANKYPSHEIVSACICKDFQIPIKLGEVSKLNEVIRIIDTLSDDTCFVKCEIAFKEI